MLAKWQPKRTKFKRVHKGTLHRCQYRKTTLRLQQGFAGLRMLKSGHLVIKQLEPARRKIFSVKKKHTKQKLWMKCAVDMPVTAKSLGLRMGKGKGLLKYWSARVLAGKTIFNVSRMQKDTGLKILQMVRKFFPAPTKLVVNNAIRKTHAETF